METLAGVSRREDDWDSRERVIELLLTYRVNTERLARYQGDETIREWQAEYQTPVVKEEMLLHHVPLSGLVEDAVEQIMAREKEKILSGYEKMNIEAQLVKLLLLHLSDSDVELLTYRYFEGFSISRVCELMYFSRSTFYRRHDEIIDDLTAYYSSLFHPQKVPKQR